MPILAILSSTRSLKSTGKHVFGDGTDRLTDIVTYRLNQPSGPIQAKTQENQESKFIKTLKTQKSLEICQY